MEKSKLSRYTSIIVCSHVPNAERARLFKHSLKSLIETTKDLPVEIIVVDMGTDTHTSGYLDGLLMGGAIHCVIHNSSNLSFGIGRNQGYACAYGDYICIADNDILYKEGWLEQCLEFLENHPHEKIYVSQIEYPTGFLKERYDVGKLDGWNLNMRAGSNCFVMRRKDYDVIGGWLPHRIAGTKWTDRACKLGYVCAVSPYGLCEDIGLRNGYAHSTPIAFKRKLTNGEEIYFNGDEFNNMNPDLNYQKI